MTGHTKNRPPIPYTRFPSPARRRIGIGDWVWSITDGIDGQVLARGRAWTERGADRKLARALSRCEPEVTS